MTLMAFSVLPSEAQLVINELSAAHSDRLATVLFGSSVDFPPSADGSGRMAVPDPHPTGDKRFYRVRVVEK